MNVSLIGYVWCAVMSALCDPWTVAHQATLSMGFSRQGYWSALPFPSPGDLPDLGIKPVSCIGRRFFTAELPGKWGFPGGASGKETACQCRRKRDEGSIPGLGRSPGVGNGNSILAWRIPWTEEPGGLQSMGLLRVGRN